jgi:hypothetical protein
MKYLIRGVSRETIKWGRQGIIIRKIYATSETSDGIALGYGAKMRMIRRLNNGDRFVFSLDVAESDLPILRPYKQALAKWQAPH